MSVTVRLVRKPAILLADGSIGGDVRIAPTITDASIPDKRAALSRAQAALDVLGVQRVSMTATMPAPGHIMPGSVGRIIDSERGPVAAKLTSITYTITIDDERNLTADAQLTVERIDD